ncbi:MAG: heme-binding protein [Methylovirgula sp.]|uniref:GlcG/HbpS family heme-binding protein n=1 Tax=Methylovirgula sp. TaxID=1978224 RepID=UPI0030764573
MSVSLDQAEAIVKTARAKAVEIGVAATVLVLDEAGHLKAFARMEHAWLGSIDVAMKKARTSVLFQMETQQVWEVCKPGAQAQGLELTNDGLVTFAGGIPLKTSSGQLIGAIGVSGGQVAQDFEIARAGLSALSA